MPSFGRITELERRIVRLEDHVRALQSYDSDVTRRAALAARYGAKVVNEILGPLEPPPPPPIDFGS